MIKHTVTEKRGPNCVLLIMCERWRDARDAIERSVRSHCRTCQSSGRACDCRLQPTAKYRHLENYHMVTPQGAHSPCGTEWIIEITSQP